VLPIESELVKNEELQLNDKTLSLFIPNKPLHAFFNAIFISTNVALCL